MSESLLENEGYALDEGNGKYTWIFTGYGDESQKNTIKKIVRSIRYTAEK